MERLQRVLAARGVASRRAAEELIRQGRVSVDGVVVTQLGTKIDAARAKITLDGKPVRAQTLRYVLLNKPRGFITTTSDERGRATVMDLVSIPQRVYPVGRLDRDTEGLLLLTNDGDVANRAMHPRYGLDKEYHVLTLARPTPQTLQRVRDGIVVEGRRVVPREFRILRESREGLILTITIHEGIYHVVRTMMEAVGIPVERLRRVRVGPLSIAGLTVGTWRELTSGELATLQEALHLDRDRPGERTGRPLPRSTGEPVRRPPARRGQAALPTEPAERDGHRAPAERSPDRRYLPRETERPERPSRGDRRSPADRDQRASKPPRGRPPAKEQPERREEQWQPRTPADGRPPRRERTGPRPSRGDRRSGGGGQDDRRARPGRPPRRDLH
jgi:23S rRNA pseudouridine2605 synthase